MTPAARCSAAIGVLDRILDGVPAEVALANWGRASRFAGSGDRVAVRDLVFDALRCKRSFAALGGAMTGRGLILGWARHTGADVAALFTGVGHAPAPPVDSETAREASLLERLDCPDWLAPDLKASLGIDFEGVMLALRRRAPVFLRVNLARIDRDGAIAALAAEGVSASLSPLARSALEVTANARKIQMTSAYATGLVELQDASSQAVAEAVPLTTKARVLDLCAGGGGKTLALAARGARVFAHDIDPGRMRDLPERAARARAVVRTVTEPEREAPFDVVLVDAPCSGSGSWRRDPQGKWALTEERLATLRATQAQILTRAASLTAPRGHLVYATCSLLAAENVDRIAAFLAEHAGWEERMARQFLPLSGGDGFFVSILARI